MYNQNHSNTILFNVLVFTLIKDNCLFLLCVSLSLSATSSTPQPTKTTTSHSHNNQQPFPIPFRFFFVQARKCETKTKQKKWQIYREKQRYKVCSKLTRLESLCFVCVFISFEFRLMWLIGMRTFGISIVELRQFRRYIGHTYTTSTPAMNGTE